MTIRYPSSRRWPLVAMAGLTVAGCTASSTLTSSSPASSPADTPTPVTTTGEPTTPDTSGLTGLGATSAAWDSTHTADTRFDPGNAYNPDTGLGDHDRFDAAYYAVLYGDGDRVTGYQRRFPRGTTLREALAAVQQQDMPADAKVVWQRELGTCYQVQLRSATLDKALGADPSVATTNRQLSDDPAGNHVGPSVEFNSDEVTPGGSGYDRTNVVGALVDTTYASAPRYGNGC